MVSAVGEGGGPGPVLRQPNVVDLYRMAGCFAVVWHHSNLYGSLPEPSRSLVDIGKMFFVSWAMPFFYLTTARYAYRSFASGHGIAYLIRRVAKLLVLLTAYSAVYEIPRLCLYLKGIVTADGSGYRWLNGASTVGDVVKTVWAGNHSPPYFLSHVIVISGLAFSIAFLGSRCGGRQVFPVLAMGMLLAFSFSFVSEFERLARFFLLPRVALIALLVGVAFELFVDSGVEKRRFNVPVSLLFLLVPIVCYGLIEMAFSVQIASADRLPLLFAVWGFGIFFIDSMVSISHLPAVSKMALAGQKYSMGIYLWHLFFMVFLDWALPLLVSAMRLDLPRIATFVLVNLLAFVLALTFTRVVFKSHRYWISV